MACEDGRIVDVTTTTTLPVEKYSCEWLNCDSEVYSPYINGCYSSPVSGLSCSIQYFQEINKYCYRCLMSTTTTQYSYPVTTLAGPGMGTSTTTIPMGNGVSYPFNLNLTQIIGVMLIVLGLVTLILKEFSGI